MPSEPISTLVIENMAARFGNISQANGDWFNVLPAQVQTVKRDQTDQTSSGLPAVIVFPMDEDFTRQGKQGFDAPYMFATGTLSGVAQAMMTTDFRNPGQYVRDAGRLKVDMWKAFTADRSNGGLCDDSIITKVWARPVSSDLGQFALTMLWKTIIRTIVNDPTQSRAYTNPTA